MLHSFALFSQIKTELMRNFNGLFWVNLFFKATMVLGKAQFSNVHSQPLAVVYVHILGMGKSVPQGAMTTINCAVNPTLNSQQAFYYSDGMPKQPSNIARYSYINTMSALIFSGLYFHELWQVHNFIFTVDEYLILL